MIVFFLHPTPNPLFLGVQFNDVPVFEHIIPLDHLPIIFFLGPNASEF